MPGSVGDQLGTAMAMGLREWRRNPVLWVLLVVVPAVFILLSDAITPHGLTPVVLAEDGRRAVELLDPAHIHAGTMAPIAVASLATLTGLFVVLDACAGDQRLALAGLRPGVLLVARLAVIALAALLATGASLAVTATVFDAHQWGLYAAATALLAITYGCSVSCWDPSSAGSAACSSRSSSCSSTSASDKAPCCAANPPTGPYTYPATAAPACSSTAR